MFFFILNFLLKSAQNRNINIFKNYTIRPNVDKKLKRLDIS